MDELGRLLLRYLGRSGFDRYFSTVSIATLALLPWLFFLAHLRDNRPLFLIVSIAVLTANYAVVTWLIGVVFRTLDRRFPDELDDDD
jgi:hypothetical protein